MTVVARTSAERPDLPERPELENVWPEYNRHGEVTNRFWGRLYDDFPEFQFVLYDEAAERPLAEGHTIPCRWDGTPERLPRGIDGLLEDAFALREAGAAPNTLSAQGPLPAHADRALRSLDARRRAAVRPVDPDARAPRRRDPAPGARVAAERRDRGGVGGL